MSWYFILLECWLLLCLKSYLPPKVARSCPFMSFVLSFISLISTAEVQCSASPSPSDSALPLVGILRALHKHAMTIHDSHFAARRHTQPHIARLCDLFKEWIGKGLRLQQVRHLKQELVGVLKPEEVPRNCWYVWTMRASDRERQTEIERERALPFSQSVPLSSQSVFVDSSLSSANTTFFVCPKALGR